MCAPFIERCHLPILVVAGAQGWIGVGPVGEWLIGVVVGNWWMDKVRYTCPQEGESAHYEVRARADE